MDAQPEVLREDSPTHGRYAVRIAGVAGEAEMTFSKTTPKLVIADHTSVPDSMRGMGIGSLLVNRLISDARAEGYRIIPLCPFVKSQYARHPEWADVMET
jgi:predicted GNAT family acetyltransferase